MRRFIIFLIIIGVGAYVCLQAQVSGVVLDEHGEPLVGANVYWAGTGIGVAADLDGAFTLMPTKSTNRLVASFVGCHNDTITVLNRQPLTIVLIDEAVLDEVTITDPNATTAVRTIATPRTTSGRIYTLDGRYVGTNPNQLPHGLYVIDGKKVIR